MSQRETKDEYIARLEVMAGIKQPAPPTEREGEREARCSDCGRPATCFGAYEMHPPNYACDVCCGHGNEDGWCLTMEEVAEEIARLRTHSPEEPVGYGVFEHVQFNGSLGEGAEWIGLESPVYPTLEQAKSARGKLNDHEVEGDIYKYRIHPIGQPLDSEEDK